MPRWLLAALIGVLATPAALSAASVQTRIGTPGPDRLIGTPFADRLNGLGGSDLLVGARERDVLTGGGGDDRIAAAQDGATDTIRCGPGRDIVTAESLDRVAPDCEVLNLQLSRDLLFGPDAQHRTEVEPDSFADGSTLVTAFQSGRYIDGGAAAIGWATSHDAGRTWRSGFLPHLSSWSSPSGVYDRVADPVVARDAAHRLWLIASIGSKEGAARLLVSRSPDGIAWSAPVTVGREDSGGIDKEWVSCDNWPLSRFRGGCYLSYLDEDSRRIATRSSSDGGLTWSEPVLAAVPEPQSNPNGAQPVVRPDGSLLVVYALEDTRLDHSEIAAVRSIDGGASFGAETRVAALETESISGMRAPPLPSVDVDRAGTIYVAWSDCRFRPSCAADDIVLARSRDGLTWSDPTRVPAGPPGSRMDYFVPGLAVDPATSGARARVAVAYHSLLQQGGCDRITQCPGLDVWLAVSDNAGRTWATPQRLTPQSVKLAWIADTGIGRMVGDYISTSWTGGRPVPVFSLGSAPEAGELRQAIFATTRSTSS